MVLIDSDSLVLDLRYPRDSRFSVNQQVLQRLAAQHGKAAITLQALLELVGILSFNSKPQDVFQLPDRMRVQYGLAVIPDYRVRPDYAGCLVPQLVGQMSQKMGLGDAVQAVQIALYASTADCLLTWNAKHVVGKLAIPVFTPQEWLNQQLGGTP